MSNYIYIKKRRYYYYGKYSTWDDAYRMTKIYKKKNKKNKYFILKTEVGYLFPYVIYKLYFTHIINLGIIN